MKKLELHTYSIEFDEIKTSLKYLLAYTKYSSLFVLVDENTRKHCLPLIQDVIPEESKFIQIESGEKNKNLDTCKTIWAALLNQGADRHSLMINLGGGVIGDMGGFCAATFMRGIRFVQIPTTLLSQVDASVGSKLGIDFKDVKNIIGLFHDPIAVLIDFNFLQTLSSAELRSGYAEVIKHALIQDSKIWQELQQIEKVDLAINWDDIIYRSVQIKHEVVSQDRKESGLRKILNFGHTIGHALESYFLKTDTPLLHGEAIAWGMYMESVLANQYFQLSDSDLEQLKEYIQKMYGDKYPNHFDADALIAYMQQDKKNVNNQISFSLLNKIGSCKPDQFIEEALLTSFFDSLKP